MKKVGIVVLAVSLFLPSVGLAQSKSKESKKEKIVRLEGTVSVLETENAQNRENLKQAQQRADSLVDANAQLKAQLQMLNAQHAALQAQTAQEKARGDSLETVNRNLQAQIIRAEAKRKDDAKKKAAAEKAAREKEEQMSALQEQKRNQEQKEREAQAKAADAEQAELDAQDVHVISRMNANLPWYLPSIDPDMVSSIYVYEGCYWVNETHAKSVVIYRFSTNGKYISHRESFCAKTSGRKVKVNFREILD